MEYGEQIFEALSKYGRISFEIRKISELLDRLQFDYDSLSQDCQDAMDEIETIVDNIIDQLPSKKEDKADV